MRKASKPQFLLGALLGTVVSLLLLWGAQFIRPIPIQAASPAASEKLEFEKKARSEIQTIVADEFARFVTDKGLTAAGEELIQGIAKKRVIQILTQETSNQIREIRKTKSWNINYNKSQVPTHVAISADGQIVVASGTEGILVSHDSGNTWDKVVED
jgi:hypothetical protein